MTDNSDTFPVLLFTGIERTFASLPVASQHSLAQRGFAHYLGNEQTSRLVAKIKSALVERAISEAAAEGRTIVAKNLDDSVTASPAVKAYRAEFPEQVSVWAQELIAKALAALDAGTIGAGRGEGAPKLDPIDRVMHRLAKEAVVTTLKAIGIDPPRGEATVDIGGTHRTMAQLIAGKLARDGEHFRKAAEKELAASRKKLEAAKETLAGAETSLAALGLE